MSSSDCARSICALAVVFIFFGFITALNMNNICLLLENNASIASNNSCTEYYMCSNGVATSQSCSSGTYFDKNSQACVSQPPSYCANANTDPCAGLATDTYAAVPGSCSGFYYCSADGPERSDCPNNLVFNVTTQSCDYRTKSNCPTQSSSGGTGSVVVNLCSYIQDNIYFGNAFNCAGWQICINSETYYTGTCKNSLVFDTTNAICNYAEDVDCSQVTDDPDLNVGSPSNGGACSQTGAKKKATACNQYYECSNGNWQLQVCSGSLYFDTESQQCANRLNATNDCDRCLGTTKKFVNEFGTNCTGYLYCSNGVQKSSASCASGLFFNEVLGGCIDENPNFPCCETTSTTTTTPAETTTVGSTANSTSTSTIESAATSTTVKPATESTTEQNTTVPTTKASATESTTDQNTTVPTTKASATESTTEQNTTVLTTKASATESTTDQNTTVPTTKASATESTTEQNTTVPTTKASATESTTDQNTTVLTTLAPAN